MTDYCPPNPTTILPVYNPENWIDTCQGTGGGGGIGPQGPQGILGISGVQGIQGPGGSAGGLGLQGTQGIVGATGPSGSASAPSFLFVTLTTNLATNFVLYNGANPSVPPAFTFPFDIAIQRGIFAPSGQNYIAFQFLSFPSGVPIANGYQSIVGNVTPTTTCGLLSIDFTSSSTPGAQGSINVYRTNNLNVYNVSIVYRSRTTATADYTNSFTFSSVSTVWGIRFGTFSSISGFTLDVGAGGSVAYNGSASIIAGY